MSVAAACRKFTHCYLVTADKLPPSLDCRPQTFSMHFLPKDKCKFSLKKEKQFSVRHKLQTHQHARPFLLLSDNRVYMHVWTKTNLVKSQRGKLLVWNKNLKHQDSFLSLSLSPLSLFVFSSSGCLSVSSCFLTTRQDLAELEHSHTNHQTDRAAAKPSDQPLSPCPALCLSPIRTG